MDSKNLRTGTEMVEDLASVAFETDQFPSKSEAIQILEEEGIDPKRIGDWTLEKLKGVRARQKLNAAREKRILWEKTLANLMSKTRSLGSTVRESVLAQLRVLGESDPEAAQIYCRKFESMSDEDLPDLEAELALLQKLDEEDNE